MHVYIWSVSTIINDYGNGCVASPDFAIKAKEVIEKYKAILNGTKEVET